MGCETRNYAKYWGTPCEGLKICSSATVIYDLARSGVSKFRFLSLLPICTVLCAKQCFQLLIEQSSLVSKVAGHGLNDWSSISNRDRERDFSVCHHFQTGLASSSILSNESQGCLTSGTKWLKHEANHSPPTNAKMKNVWGF